MQYFVWLALLLCTTGCAATTIEEPPADPVSDEAPIESPTDPAPEETSIDITEFDLAAEDTTFLNKIDDLSAGVEVKSYALLTDTRGIAWQGVSLLGGDGEGLLLQPIQGGGGLAVHIAGPLDAMSHTMNVTALSGINVEQSAALPDAEITFVRATLSGDSWKVSVAVDHPDTGWEDYTDGWQVETPDGQLLTTRILLHPHVGERPFTRSSSNFEVPADVTEIVIRSHDLISGYETQPLLIPIAEAGSGPRYEVVR